MNVIPIALSAWLFFVSINFIVPCRKNATLDCYDEKSYCKGRCGAYRFSPCSCDGICIVYNNCCEDFEQECPNEFLLASRKWKRYQSIEVRCQPNYYYPEIAVCPPSTTNSREHSLCISDQPTIMGDMVRVTDPATGLSFKNIYCLRCNEPNASGINWDGQVSIIKRLPYQPYSPNDMFELHLKGYVNFTWAPPESVVPRFCLAPNDNECDKCSNNSSLAELCRSTISPVMVKRLNKQTFYRNKHCAQCAELDAMGDASCIAYEASYLGSRATEFSILIRWNAHTGAWHSSSVGGKIIWDGLICSNGSEKCSASSCKFNFEVIDGKCNYDNTLKITIKVRFQPENNKTDFRYAIDLVKPAIRRVMFEVVQHSNTSSVPKLVENEENASPYHVVRMFTTNSYRSLASDVLISLRRELTISLNDSCFVGEVHAVVEIRNNKARGSRYREKIYVNGSRIDCSSSGLRVIAHTLTLLYCRCIAIFWHK